MSATVGVNLAKGRALLQKKREEDKLRPALEKVNAANGIPKTPITAGNPTGDPLLEACVLNGVCIASVAGISHFARIQPKGLNSARHGRAVEECQGVCPHAFQESTPIFGVYR